MNYLKEIIAFEREMEIRHLPANAQLLWYKLMMLCNKTGWQPWFQVDNPRLMAHLKMTRAATLIEARQKLILAGRIHYRRGKKGAPSQYHLIPFEAVPQNAGQTEGQSAPQGEGQTVAISKQKHKDKQKKSEGTPAIPVSRQKAENEPSATPTPPPGWEEVVSQPVRLEHPRHPGLEANTTTSPTGCPTMVSHPCDFETNRQSLSVEHEQDEHTNGGQPTESSRYTPPTETSHGRYHHVRLTAPQLSDLKAAHPGGWQALIQNLDTYLETHPQKHYHNHLAIMEKWAAEDLTHPTGRKALCPEIQRDLSIYDELDAMDAAYFKKIGEETPS